MIFFQGPVFFIWRVWRYTQRQESRVAAAWLSLRQPVWGHADFVHGHHWRGVASVSLITNKLWHKWGSQVLINPIALQEFSIASISCLELAWSPYCELDYFWPICPSYKLYGKDFALFRISKIVLFLSFFISSIIINCSLPKLSVISNNKQSR